MADTGWGSRKIEHDSVLRQKMGSGKMVQKIESKGMVKCLHQILGRKF